MIGCAEADETSLLNSSSSYHGGKILILNEKDHAFYYSES